jgi:molybdate transport system substrate-binding protein
MKRYAIIARIIFSLALALWAVHGTYAHAAEIRILSTNGVHSVMAEMVPAFERATGNKVSIAFENANRLLGKIKGGEAADLVIMTRPTINELSKLGKVAAGSDRDLARSGVGIAIRAGLPKPDISTPDKLKRALLQAKSITYSKSGASGIHFAKVIERLGIADQVKAKSKLASGAAVGKLVAEGKVEMAAQQIPELLAVKGLQLVGPLPAELQEYTTFTAAVMAGAKQPQAAKAFIDFITTPAAVKVFKAKGMEP